MSESAAKALPANPTAEEVKPAPGTESRQDTDPTGSGEAAQRTEPAEVAQREKPEEISNPAEWMKNARGMSERIMTQSLEERAKPPVVAEEKPASEQPATEEKPVEVAPVVEKPVEAAPTPKVDDEEDSSKSRVRINRANFKSDDDYRVAVKATKLSNEYGLTPSKAEAEARRLLGIETPQENQPAPEKPTGEPQARTDGKPATVALTDARIKELTEQRSAALKADLDHDKYDQLTQEIESLREHKIDLRDEDRSRVVQERESFDQQELISRAEAVRLHPDCVNANSPLVAEMKALNEEWKTDKNPLFHSPNKPLLLAERAAERIKRLAPAKPAAASPQPVTEPRPAQPAAPPLAGGSARTTPTAQPQGQLLKELNGISNANEYGAALRKLGVPVQF